ncbi:MAG TPA: hypothetical protein VGG53_08190 [Mycobacterium sp.]|uniref:hypothetical protein n=1 Tax=Mycobacterium sp. TaxID=1785 RepID=UPI002F3EAA3B
MAQDRAGPADRVILADREGPADTNRVGPTDTNRVVATAGMAPVVTSQVDRAGPVVRVGPGVPVGMSRVGPAGLGVANRADPVSLGVPGVPVGMSRAGPADRVSPEVQE